MKINKELLTQLGVFLGLMMLSATGFAAELSPLSNGATMLKNTVLGTAGISIATIGVAGTGVACAYGYLDWSRLIYVVIGVAIMFGSPAIVSTIQSIAR